MSETATKLPIESREPVRYLSSQSNPNDVSLLPYAQVDGRWTLPDEVILSAARQFQKDGTFKTVFREGGILSPIGFLEELQKPANIPVFAFRGREVMGLAWLNGIGGNHAFAHFCFLVSAWGPDTVRAGRMILDYWMAFESGEHPVFDVILGTPPETSGPAVKYAESIGFFRLGLIPKMVENVYTGKKCAAVVLYYVRP